MKKQNGITLIALIITIIVMLILVGVTINVAINGGLFTTAKRAATEMSKAQIQERAEIVKITLMADMQGGNDTTTGVVQAYKEKLQEEFGTDNIVILGNKVTVDGKYDIVIKNTDLDIEVTEGLDIMNVPITLETVTTNEEDKVILTLKIKVAMTEEEFVERLENATIKQKEKELEDFLYIETGGQINTVDEYVLFILEEESKKGYTSIEQYQTDKDVLDLFGETDGKVDKEQIYYYLLTEGKTDGRTTREEAISEIFKQIYGEPEQAYENLSEVFKVKIDDTTYTITDASYSQETILTHDLYRSGTHEIIITNSNEEIVAVEKLNIKTSNKYVWTKEEANGIWETDGRGRITAYLGEDSFVQVPACIGDEVIYAIGNRSMDQCEFIKEIEIPNSITTIETHAFAFCTSLEKITIPNSIKSIGSYVFYECSALKEIVLPNSITKISDSLFENCTSLSKVTIPDSVTIIEKFAFSHCESLKTIKLPESLTSMGGVVFSGSGLEEITIPNSVKTMGINVFESCKSLKKVELPNLITTIGDYMFGFCTSLKEITIPNSVESISYCAFWYCEDIIITFEKGENQVPSGFDWGATSATLIDLNNPPAQPTE